MECSFCGEEVRLGTGVLISRKDGTLSYYCSGKCKKNQIKLKREGRRKKWTKNYELFMGKKSKENKK